jgi:hypothetical protein
MKYGIETEDILSVYRPKIELCSFKNSRSYFHRIFTFRSDVYYQCNNVAVGFEVLKVVTIKSMILWVGKPCRSGGPQRFGGTYRLHQSVWAQLVACFCCIIAWLTLKMEAIYFYEMSGSLRTTRHCNPEDRTLRSYYSFPSISPGINWDSRLFWNRPRLRSSTSFIVHHRHRALSAYAVDNLLNDSRMQWVY